MIRKIFALFSRSYKQRLEFGLGLNPGDKHYRAYVGPPENYDLVAAMTFGLATSLGLRQHHTLLDIGCGSLRIGRLLIPYLNAGGYVGIEPNDWLVKEGIAKEIGQDLIDIKKPTFYFSDSAKELNGNHLFDFAVAQSIFSHCGAGLLNKWLEETSSILKPTGALIATFLIGDKDPEPREWVYPGCVRYKVETMDSYARDHGFRFQILDWRHPGQTWAVFARPEFDTSWFEGRPLGWNTFVEFGPKVNAKRRNRRPK